MNEALDLHVGGEDDLFLTPDEEENDSLKLSKSKF